MLHTKSAGLIGEENNPEVIAKALKDALDQVKGVSEDLKTKFSAQSTDVEGIKAKFDETFALHNEIKGRLGEIEQKLVRQKVSQDGHALSLGKSVVNDETMKAFLSKAATAKGRVQVEVKAITSAGASAGPLLNGDRQPGIVTAPNRRMTVRNLLTPGNTAMQTIEFMKELVYTNNAAPVAENTLKPESDITFELVTRPVRTIAHWLKASRQILADVPMLASTIDGRLRYGLAFKEELQLLKGDGTGQNLLGLIPQATAYSAPFVVASATSIDIVRLAMAQAILAEYPANGIILNPSDWARIELLKDTQNRYLIGDPQSGTTPTLWRLPVVETQAMDVDKFMVGAFDLAAQIFDREDATVELSTEDSDNFTKNMVTMLAEQRLALAVYRPQSLIYGDFGIVA